jgi:autotransporter-associated beta strand protein
MVVLVRSWVSCVVGFVLLLAIAEPAAAATCVWQGTARKVSGEPDNRWSQAGNWLCDGVARAPADTADSLIFPNGAAQPDNVDDIPQLAVAAVFIQGRGAGLAAWFIHASTGIDLTMVMLSVDAPTDPTGHGPSLLVPLTLGGSPLLAKAFSTGPSVGLLTLGALNLNGRGIEFNVSAPVTVFGSISGDARSSGAQAVEKNGPSVLTLNDNSYAGGTAIQSGVLVANTNHAIPPTSPVQVGTSGSLVLADGVVLAASVSLNGGSIAVPVDASATLTGAVSVTTPSSLAPAGTLTIAGQIQAGAAALTQTGGGTVIVSNAGTGNLANQPHPYTLHNGTLRVGAVGALARGTALTLAPDPTDSATLDLNNFNATLASLDGVGGGHVRLGSGTLTLDLAQNTNSTYLGTVDGAGNVVKTGAGLLRWGGTPANTYTGTTTVSRGGLILQKSATTPTIAGPLVIDQNGVLLTSGVPTGAPGDQLADGATVTVNGSWELASPETIGSLSGTGTVTLETMSAQTVLPTALTVGANNATGIFAGELVAPPASTGPAVRFVKIGTGTLTLTGSVLMPGDRALVAGGTLLVDGQMNTPEVRVQSGGLLGGTGTLFNVDTRDPLVSRITVTGGGVISPGHRDGGVLHADAASIGALGTLAIVLNGPTPGAGYNQLALTDNLTLDPAAQLHVTRRFDAAQGTTFTIVSLAAGKTVTGTFAGLPEGGTLELARQRFQITYHGGDGNDVVLRALEVAPPPTYFLSEGATGDFFDEDILIANPNTADAPVTMTFSKEDGSQVVEKRTVPAQSRITVHVDAIAGLEKVSGLSAQVASDSRVPLVVERSMFWDASYYAGSTGSSVDAPAPDWFFAEGSQGFFSTFVLVNNPHATPTDVTFTFLLESGATVLKTVTVGSTTRVTLYAGDVPQLVNQSFGIAVRATQPIMAEWSMYFGTRPDGRVWCGGTESAGVTAPSTHWFLAEGATGGFFNTYVLLSNADSAPASVSVQYLLPDGEAISVQKSLPAHTRLTTNIGVDEADTRLHNTAVSTVVTADRPIIAERSMYWPGAIAPFGEGHNSFGVVDAGVKWGLAEGRTGTPLNYHTYILLANPQTTAATVTVTFLRENGAPLVKTYTVAATSRFNIDSATIPELHDEYFGAVIEVTNNVPIIVERSLYWDSNGYQFSGGTNATAIRLP